MSVSSPISHPVGDSGRHSFQLCFCLYHSGCTELSVLMASAARFHLYFHQCLKQRILTTHILVISLSYRFLRPWVHPGCLGQSRAADAPFLRRAWPSGRDRARRTECEDTATPAPSAPPTVGAPDASTDRVLGLRLSRLSLPYKVPTGVGSGQPWGGSVPSCPVPAAPRGAGQSLSRDAGWSLSPVPPLALLRAPTALPQHSVTLPRDTGQCRGDRWDQELPGPGRGAHTPPGAEHGRRRFLNVPRARRGSPRLGSPGSRQTPSAVASSLV